VPELITHGSVAFLLKALNRRPWTPLFLAGTVLPDLLARVPGSVLVEVHDRIHPLPEALLYAPEVAHLPAGIVLWSLAFSFLFPEKDRLAICWNLLAGGLLHILLDLMQRHEGAAYTLFFPFHHDPFQFGWFGTEATVLFAPVLAVLAVVTWRVRRGPRPL